MQGMQSSQVLLQSPGEIAAAATSHSRPSLGWVLLWVALDRLSCIDFSGYWSLRTTEALYKVVPTLRVTSCCFTILVLVRYR